MNRTNNPTDKVIFASRSLEEDRPNCNTLIRGTVFVRTENDAHQELSVVIRFVREACKVETLYKIGDKCAVVSEHTPLEPRGVNKGEFSQRIWQWTWEPLGNINRLLRRRDEHVLERRDLVIIHGL